METKLSLISEIAVKDRECKFNNLMHMLSVEGLRECFYLLSRDKASGVDSVTFEEYEKDIETNLRNLVERMKRISYRPQPVRRVYIPKSSGKKRPIGIPALEDKIVQKGIARILAAIYEVDFMAYPMDSGWGGAATMPLIVLTKSSWEARQTMS